jgi:putative intracellular protease/amidase
MTKSILMIVSNPAISSTLGIEVGFWASELFHPYKAFEEKGYAVTIASPDGGKVVLDSYSDPRDESRYSADDVISLDYLENRPDVTARLENTPALGDVNLASFDAIMVCGGQAPMFSFDKATRLHRTILDFYQAGKPTAALCHGTSALLYVDNGNFVTGKKMTGFANSEEDIGDSVVGTKMMPFRIEDVAKAKGADFQTAPAFEPFALQDGNLITGQQQHSGTKVAELVIAALEAA